MRVPQPVIPPPASSEVPNGRYKESIPMRTWAHWTAKTVMLTVTFAAAGAGFCGHSLRGIRRWRRQHLRSRLAAQRQPGQRAGQRAASRPAVWSSGPRWRGPSRSRWRDGASGAQGPRAAGHGPDGYRGPRAQRTYVTSGPFCAVGSSYRTAPSSLPTAVIPSLRQLC